jgi:hypothetical protein
MLTTGQRVTAKGFTGTLEGFARDGELAVVVGDDGVSSRRIAVADLVDEVRPFACAECGTSGEGTYVVTVLDADDADSRTEVCRNCDDALRDEPYAGIAERVAIRDYAWHRDGEPCMRAMSTHDCSENHRYGRTFEGSH